MVANCRTDNGSALMRAKCFGAVGIMRMKWGS